MTEDSVRTHMPARDISNGHIELTVIQDSESFLALREEWNELCNADPHATVFLSWEWLYNWWLVYGERRHSLLLLTTRDRGDLVGLAPLYIEGRARRVFSMLRFLGSNVVCSDYLDFIVKPDRRDAAVQVMLAFLKDRPEMWDKMDLTDIPSNSGTPAALGTFFRRHPFRAVERYTACPFVDLRRPWESTFDSLASHLRKLIARKTKRLNRDHSAEFLEMDSGGDLEPHIETFLRLNDLRFAARNMVSPFRSEAFTAFHRRVLAALLPAGRAALYFLTADGQPIAGMYLLRDAARHYLYQSGFDPAWEKYSPGTLLLHHAVSTARHAGAEEFDFLRGEEQYKRDWTGKERVNSRITIYGANWRGRLARRLDCAIEGPRKTAGRCLRRVLSGPA